MISQKDDINVQKFTQPNSYARSNISLKMHFYGFFLWGYSVSRCSQYKSQNFSITIQTRLHGKFDFEERLIGLGLSSNNHYKKTLIQQWRADGLKNNYRGKKTMKRKKFLTIYLNNLNS